MMFGPHDGDSPRSSNAMKWKIKRETNDDLRQQFIDKTIPQAELIGLKIPDPNYKLLENGSYETSDIDWEEFWNVIKGNGPCNTQRIKHHAAAHDNGQCRRMMFYSLCIAWSIPFYYIPKFFPVNIRGFIRTIF
jgi:ring-1,2-phenylacetyl-CoA epoxidase subunit PaaA